MVEDRIAALERRANTLEERRARTGGTPAPRRNAQRPQRPPSRPARSVPPPWPAPTPRGAATIRHAPRPPRRAAASPAPTAASGPLRPRRGRRSTSRTSSAGACWPGSAASPCSPGSRSCSRSRSRAGGSARSSARCWPARSRPACWSSASACASARTAPRRRSPPPRSASPACSARSSSPAPVYDLVPSSLALFAAYGVGAFATFLAARWDAQPFALARPARRAVGAGRARRARHRRHHLPRHRLREHGRRARLAALARARVGGVRDDDGPVARSGSTTPIPATARPILMLATFAALNAQLAFGLELRERLTSPTAVVLLGAQRAAAARRPARTSSTPAPGSSRSPAPTSRVGLAATRVPRISPRVRADHARRRRR